MTVQVQSDMRKSMLATALIGIGLMAGVDEIIFHQLLGWHHFYDLATPQIALFSDGLLHSAELIVLVAGFFLLSDLRGRQILDPTAAWAGFLIGLGGFQLFDGIVDHKVLRLHQIRYGIDNLLTYDLIWNASGAVLLLIGLLLSRRLRARPRMA
ncbi:DUF2243 domain-containing protein [Azotobacter salinestris]|uniref:DUF2243 domain-containing protein n=1 Tax=Azotobacter salinestris TaxID=69964 RepID=UPI0032E03582